MTGGWAGLARYIARHRARARIAARAARIDALTAEAEQRSIPRTDVEDTLTALQEEQNTDLALLDTLDRTEAGPLTRPRPTRDGDSGDAA